MGCVTNGKKDTGLVGSAAKEKEETFSQPLEEVHKPPKGIKLTSILYELAVSPEPKSFARKHDIYLDKDKVKVFISFNPVSSNSERDKLGENYNMVVEKKSNDLLRVLVPIDGLIPLSKESIVWSIRLPDRPVKLGR